MKEGPVMDPFAVLFLVCIFSLVLGIWLWRYKRRGDDERKKDA
jgi:lipopolysaccharide export LptBFGC system permease protein LptF